MVLVLGTMCMLALFLWVAMVACVAHLWSIPDDTGEKLREGPRWLVPSFMMGEHLCSFNCNYACAYVYVHRGKAA